MRSCQYSRFHSTGSSVIAAIALFGSVGGFVAAGCGGGPGDGRTVRGALAGMAAAVESHDAEQAFGFLDQRARNAWAAVVHARTRAKALIESDYPLAERAAALAALGDAAQVATPAALFALRCPAACLAAIGAQIGAPTGEKPVGDELEVQTSRGTTLHMYAGQDGWYGLVWNTPEAFAERTQASRELSTITDNAALYRKRKALEAH